MNIQYSGQGRDRGDKGGGSKSQGERGREGGREGEKGIQNGRETEIEREGDGRESERKRE